MAVLLCILVFALLGTHAAIPDPTAAATAMATQILNNHPNFFLWEYGSAIINDGMWEVLGQIPSLTFAAKLNSVLNDYENTSGEKGYNVLHNVTMPFDAAVGDGIGLFPIAYLARAAYYDKHPDPAYNPQKDVALSQLVVDNYIMKFPWVMPDATHTFCRVGTEVWCDDQFMGTALATRLSIRLKTKTYLDRIGPMNVAWWNGLSDPKTNITWHGWNYATKTPSCCKWSRANGWGMMSHVEVLKAYKAIDPNNNVYAAVKNIFQAHARAAKGVQNSDGRWHQLLDVPSTFLETSTTGMFLLSFIEGVENGWLDKDEFDASIKLAWKGLSSTIQTNGTVTGICQGTGILNNINAYEIRGTDYTASSPGLGSVLKAALAAARYLSSY